MLPWYVMHSKPNKEELLNEQLRIRQIETYYPCLKVRPANPRSLKTKPFFPGYLFIRANLEILGPSALQWIPGAIGLVDFGGSLAQVNDDLLEAIRQKVDRVNAVDDGLAEKLKPGDIVTIQTGPFAGYRAIFDSHLTGHERVRVLLQMLRDRQVGVELPAAHIERITQHPFRSTK
jgi:transcriptional antiterminator RfaH